MANTYKLTINDIPETKKNLEFTYNQNEGSTQTLSIYDKNYKCTLNNFSYTKAIYQPGEIQIELQVGKEPNAIIPFSELGTIHDAFIKKFIQLEYTGKTSLNIAENYYTFDVKIEKQGSGKPLTVKIQAFDPLKFLALDKYCMAYTCKKLIKDILINSAVWPNDIPETLTNKLSSAQTTMEEIDQLKYEIYKLNEEINDLQNQNQDTTEKEKEVEQKKKEIQTKEEDAFIVTNALFLTYTNNTDKTYTEFIQPYLVQYNESFLDFLVRVTNRCGEFFYYEDGKIHIGWKATEPITIQEYVSVKFPKMISTAWSDYAIADIHNDYTQDKNIINFAAPIVMRDSELAFDENLAKIPPKDAYTSWQDFALFPGCYFVNNISGALNSATITEMMDFYVFKSMASLINSKVLSIDTNNSYEKSNFDSSKPYFDERKNGDDLHPFSTNDTNRSVKSMTAYCLDFYTNIRNGIESAERSRLQIELGDHYSEASLGSLIQFEGDTQQYIVVKIESQIDSQTDKSGLSDGETLRIEVIPYTEGETVYPPSAHVEPMRSAKAQRAIVTHNQDPLKMNRVRVRYPWQGRTENVNDLKASEDSTPWIRIALPMASNGSGFNFLPEVGDEAIINYENGNIEKPYVEGMLYSSGQTVPFNHKRNNARVLSSVNGHCIIFSDPGASTNAIKGLFPAWNTICGFIPTAKAPLNDDVRKAMGGIELTDEYGLYSISMSSEKREISVNSPFGNVNINAFTGITISAPNGNIKIEGKNIDIVAGNNLSISSGNNIDTEFWPFKWDKDKLSFVATKKDVDFGKGLLKTAIGKLSLIDMKLIRTIIETFLRPIGGTMLIKSYRYMRLEAGKGSAKIVGRNFIKQRWFKSDKVKAFFKGSFNHDSSDILKDFHPTDNVYHIVNDLKKFILKIHRTHALCTKTINEKTPAYTSAYNTLTAINNYANNIEGVLKTTNELISDATNNTAYNPITVNNPVAEQDEQPVPIDSVLQSAVNNLNQRGKELSLIISVAKEDNIWAAITSPLSDNAKDIINNASIKPKIEAIYGDVCWHKDHTIQVQDENNIAIPKSKMREALYLILKKAIEIQDSSYNLSVESNFSNFNDKTEWDNLVNGIRFTEQQSNKKKDFLMSSLNISDMADQYVWDKTETGEILFSDKAGKTLHFSETGITDHERNYDTEAKIGDLKQTLNV